MPNATPTPQIPKVTLSQWIKNPTSVLLMLVTNFLWILGVIFTRTVSTSNDKNEANYKAQIEYLHEQIEKKDETIKDYATVMLYRNSQIKTRDRVIDSLKVNK